MKARGTQQADELFEYQNFILLSGCSPDMTVAAKTKMIEDIADVLLNRFDKTTFSILLPQYFEDLKGQDANFEMIVPPGTL